jgi:hypothetical protein
LETFGTSCEWGLLADSPNFHKIITLGWLFEGKNVDLDQL